jgi:hypothetical protein
MEAGAIASPVHAMTYACPCLENVIEGVVFLAGFVAFGSLVLLVAPESRIIISVLAV